MRSVIKLENTFIFIITIAVYVKLEFSYGCFTFTISSRYIYVRICD